MCMAISMASAKVSWLMSDEIYQNEFMPHICGNIKQANTHYLKFLSTAYQYSVTMDTCEIPEGAESKLESHINRTCMNLVLHNVQ